MAALVYAVLILSVFGRSDATWCVCRTDVSDSVLQTNIDYACGSGADCRPILQNGPCYNPNTMKLHCNYAVNSYYQIKGQNPNACYFAGITLVTNTDPSYTGCTFPSAAGTSTTTSTTTTPGTGTTTSTYNSPPGTIMGELGQSGNSMSTDSSNSMSTDAR